MPGSPGLTGLDPKLGGGGGGGGAPSVRGLEASKLFPRAGLNAVTAGTAMGAARGMSSGMMPGSPGPAGAAGRGAGGEGGKEHKRPAFLDSTEHLEEAIGEALRVVKPVVEKND